MVHAMIQAGDSLPDTELGLRDYLSDGPLLILFYTEASTPACTQQLCAFRDDFEMLQELGASVIAISADDEAALQRFREEQRFPFPLLSDPELVAAAAFGVADQAQKRAQRAAFVCDAEGVVTLAIPFYQPANLDHFKQVFVALGLDL